MSNDIQHMAKTLRKRLTDAEKILWKYLRTKQIEGCKFRRQEPVGKYIVDFVCYEKGLIIEVDGVQQLPSPTPPIKGGEHTPTPLSRGDSSLSPGGRGKG